MLSAIANHLWQSTLLAGAAFLLTLALRNHAASTRHRMWLIATLKFLVPFSLLVTAGSRIPWRTARVAEQHAIPIEFAVEPARTTGTETGSAKGPA